MKFAWLTDDARLFLHRGYIPENMSAEDRYREICNRLEEISRIPGFADKFYSYCANGWVSFSSPILSNFGRDTGLPISCNFGTVDDTLDSILHGIYEIGMLAKAGAGTAKNLTRIRPYGAPYGKDKLGKSVGLVNWVLEYSNIINKVTQGGMRRGFLTVYCNADHEEIDSFLNIGAEGNPKDDIAFAIKDITTAVIFPNGWLDEMEAGDSSKRAIYAKVLKRRSEIGFPYILFEDNCDNNKPIVYKDKDMKVGMSNICTEVIEYCDDDKEFACCLSSANLRHFDEWKDTEFIFDLNIALDCVNTEYITKGKMTPGLARAVKFMEEHRSIGIGVLGFHDYLQQNDIVFGSIESFQKNTEIFKYIQSESLKASKWMAGNWGEPAMLKGYGLRNTTRMAVAPTKSTSEIMGGVSMSIEPIKSNYHERVLAKTQSTYKNPNLKKILKKYNIDNRETWKSILEHNGSVQHLDELTDHEKQVYRTFSEISQMDIINLAAARQTFIDQGQSINLMIHPGTPPRDVSNLVLHAWKSGIKTLYYQYAINAAQQFNKELLTCSSCEG